MTLLLKMMILYYGDWLNMMICTSIRTRNMTVSIT